MNKFHHLAQRVGEVIREYFISALIPWWGWLIIGAWVGACLALVMLGVVTAGSNEDKLMRRK